MNRNSTRETAQVVSEVCQAGKAEAAEVMEEMTEPKLLVLNFENY